MPLQWRSEYRHPAHPRSTTRRRWSGWSEQRVLFKVILQIDSILFHPPTKRSYTRGDLNCLVEAFSNLLSLSSRLLCGCQLENWRRRWWWWWAEQYSSCWHFSASFSPTNWLSRPPWTNFLQSQQWSRNRIWLRQMAANIAQRPK